MTSFSHNLEFFRTGFGLLPSLKDKNPGTAVYLPQIPGSSGSTPFRSCTCAGSKKGTCRHVRELSDLVSSFQQASGRRKGRKAPAPSLWQRLGEVLHAGEDPVGRPGPARVEQDVARFRREKMGADVVAADIVYVIDDAERLGHGVLTS